MSSRRANYPCLTFKLDLRGEMGMCSCGYNQQDHKAERRKQLKENYLRFGKSGNSDIPTSLPIPKHKTAEDYNLNDLDGDEDDDGQDLEPCEEYRFDPTKPYNTCSCGFTKKDHEDAKVRRKFEAERLAREEKERSAQKTPRQLAMEKGVPCPEFEVDLANKGSYGVCLCGFSRQDHVDYRSSPQIWVETKQGLTEPKPFI